MAFPLIPLLFAGAAVGAVAMLGGGTSDTYWIEDPKELERMLQSSEVSAGLVMVIYQRKSDALVAAIRAAPKPPKGVSRVMVSVNALKSMNPKASLQAVCPASKQAGAVGIVLPSGESDEAGCWAPGASKTEILAIIAKADGWLKGAS